MNALSPSLKTRRFELDWLRVLAILAIFFFHSARFFDPSDWHVKNSTTYPGLDLPAAIVLNWIMPLVFVISGASTYYALSKRSAAEFLRDRSLRLLVPLLVGIFTHAMWQVYLDRITHHQFAGSFIDFVPHYFNGLFGWGGNFAWMGMHLWYLELLFVFSVLFLPLFLWLRRGSGRRLLDWLGRTLAFPGGVYLLALPVMLLLVSLKPSSFLGIRAFGGWAIGAYAPVFINGFIVVSNERLYDSVRRLRWISLALAIALTAAMAFFYLQRGEARFGTQYYIGLNATYGLTSWCWILAIIGFAAQHLRFGNPFLAYANEAVLPFYVMHQSVLLTVGFWVVRWQAPDLLQWAVISAISLALCLAFYEFLIRRHNLLRFLFGMRPLPRQASLQPSKPQPA